MLQPSRRMPVRRLSRQRALAAGLGLLALSVVASGCTFPQADATASPRNSATAGPEQVQDLAPAAVLSMDPPLNSRRFAPVTPIVISAGNGTISDVVIADPDGAAIPGTLSADAAVWQSAALLDYDTAYTVSASAVNADGQTTSTTGSITTVAPDNFTAASITPFGDMTSVGVGMPIVVRFDEDVENRAAVQRRLSVTAAPPVVGAWRWFGDREVHYRPQEYWAPGTHVVLDVGIYGVDVGDATFGQENRHIEFDIHDALVAQVDNSELILRTYRNGVLEREMPTSMGKEGFRTPSGTYIVMQQDRRYTMDSSTYGLPIDDPDGYGPKSSTPAGSPTREFSCMPRPGQSGIRVAAMSRTVV